MASGFVTVMSVSVRLSVYLFIHYYFLKTMVQDHCKSSVQGEDGSSWNPLLALCAFPRALQPRRYLGEGRAAPGRLRPPACNLQQGVSLLCKHTFMAFVSGLCMIMRLPYMYLWYVCLSKCFMCTIRVCKNHMHFNSILLKTYWTITSHCFFAGNLLFPSSYSSLWHDSRPPFPLGLTPTHHARPPVVTPFLYNRP